MGWGKAIKKKTILSYNQQLKWIKCKMNISKII